MKTVNVIALFGAVVCFGISAEECGSTLIVLPQTPTISERFAAKELKYHLEKATGRTFPIMSEEVMSEGQCRFYIGNVKALARVGIDFATLKVEERIVKGVGKDVFLAGGEQPGFDRIVSSKIYHREYGLAGGGTLYAVYDFLERDMGVKWLWPGELGEVIPQRDLPSLDGVERRGMEPLFRRCIRGNIEASRRIKIANRLWGWNCVSNARQEVELRMLWLTRNRTGYRRKFNFGHAFGKWHTLHKDKPEYFAMQPSGLRGRFANVPAEDGSNMAYPLCVSNPDVHRAIVEVWGRSIGGKAEKKNTVRYLNVCENDSPGFCVCKSCRAWDADDAAFASHPYWNGTIKDVNSNNRFFMGSAQWGDDGETIPGTEPPSVTDRYVKFYNAVLAEACKIYPAAEVCAYAYSNYVLPPKETKISRGVVISFVPNICFPYGDVESGKFRAHWAGWNEKGAAQMVYRPNYMHGGGMMPYSSARHMAADVNFAYAHGMIAVDHDAMNGAWSTQALKNYVAARMLREPDVKFDKMLGEFLSAFGAGAEDVMKYCDMLEALNDIYISKEWAAIGRANRTVRGSPGGGWRYFMMNIADLYSEEWFASADALLASAESKTLGKERLRVSFLRKGLTDGLLTYRTRVAQKSGDYTAFRAAFKTLVDYRSSIEAENICAWAVFADREQTMAGWPHKTQRYYSGKK